MGVVSGCGRWAWQVGVVGGRGMYSHILSSSGTVRLVDTSSGPGGLSTCANIHLPQERRCGQQCHVTC